jgi:hypothetical protein
MTYNAFFTYGAWQYSATHKKRLKTAIFQPCLQWAQLFPPAIGKKWAQQSIGATIRTIAATKKPALRRV